MTYIKRFFVLLLIFFQFCFVDIVVASSASWDRIYDFWITYSCYDTSVVQSTLNSYAAPFDGVYRISTLNDNLYVANVGYTQRPPVGSCLIAIDLSGWYNIETSFCGCGGGSESGCCCLSALMHQNVSWDDLNYTLGIESVSSVAKRFYLQSSDLTIKNITGTVAAYIQKEDGSWMFLKNLQYLFSPGEEGIDFKCNSYKFEYVLDESPCGPQTYTLIKNREKNYKVQLEPVYYEPVNFVPQPTAISYNYSVSGVPSWTYYLCVNSAGVGFRCGFYSPPSFSWDQVTELPLGDTYTVHAWREDWSNDWVEYPVTLTLNGSAPGVITWIDYYSDASMNNYYGGWYEDGPFARFLSDTYLGDFVNAYVSYGTDGPDDFYEPVNLAPLDILVSTPIITNSGYYDSNCVWTTPVVYAVEGNSLVFSPGEMCVSVPGVEVWYIANGQSKYKYLEGAYETNCRALGHYSEGVYSKASGGKQKMMGHQFRGGYEKRIPAP